MFDFAAGTAAKPVIDKAAFFAGFGWVMALEDGCHWAQFIDGTQMVAADTHVVSVSKEGARSVLTVQGGLLQAGAGAGEVGRRADSLLSLRQVL